MTWSCGKRAVELPPSLPYQRLATRDTAIHAAIMFVFFEMFLVVLLKEIL
jgi:hypothetical protein